MGNSRLIMKGKFASCCAEEVTATACEAAVAVLETPTFFSKAELVNGDPGARVTVVSIDREPGGKSTEEPAIKLESAACNNCELLLLADTRPDTDPLPPAVAFTCCVLPVARIRLSLTVAGSGFMPERLKHAGVVPNMNMIRKWRGRQIDENFAFVFGMILRSKISVRVARTCDLNPS